MQARFWGTRGSLAKPGPGTLRYGGNTSCVEVRTAGGATLVLDCGTGAHGLGQALLASGEKPRRGHMFITHTHWDHIQGFPFFAPLFVPGAEWDIYAPGGLGQRLAETLAGQMEYTYFPVTLSALAARIRYHDLIEGEYLIDDVRVRARYLNHPALTLGYRFEAGGVSLVYAVDHEPHAPHQLGAGAVLHREDQAHADFLAGADLVIHDTQYTLQEYAGKIGWGHSPAEWVTDLAAAAGVKRLALFHHDPLRDDAAVDRLLEVCRERAAGLGGMQVLAAAEGQSINLVEAAYQSGLAAPAVAWTESRPVGAGERRPTVLVVEDDDDTRGLLLDTLEPHGLRLIAAGDGEAALRIAVKEKPDLLLLDRGLPGRSGIEVCRALRSHSDPHLQQVPIVFLTASNEESHIAEGFAAGATDYMTKPFSTAHVRSRVRGWLLRSRPLD